MPLKRERPKLDDTQPLPCPFCGRPLITQDEAEVWWHRSMVDCIMSGKVVDKKFEAIAAWNTRATPSYAEGRAAGCHGLDTPERVCFYEQDFYVLSNFSAFSLRWKGQRFDTSEAVYHWEKFCIGVPASLEVQNNIYHARSAHDAFKIAEANKRYRRPDWDDVKVDVMREILRKKVEQHEYVRRKLLATGDRELVENSWRDDFWGWGPNGDGKNMLGKLWMEVRAELREALIGAAP